MFPAHLEETDNVFVRAEGRVDEDAKLEQDGLEPARFVGFVSSFHGTQTALEHYRRVLWDGGPPDCEGGSATDKRGGGREYADVMVANVAQEIAEGGIGAFNGFIPNLRCEREEQGEVL